MSCGARGGLILGGAGGGELAGASSSSSAVSSASSGSGTTCAPGGQRACYDGPPGTSGIGACVAGTQTCRPDGAGFGPCAGQVLPTPEDCTSPVDEDCDGIATCSGAVLWQRSLPMYADSVITDAANNIYVAGWGGAGVDFGDGVVTTGEGIWNVVKLGPDGHALWARTIPSTGATSGGLTRQLATDGVDVYFAASFDQTGNAIVKLDPDGNTLWARTTPSPGAGTDTISIVVEASGRLDVAMSPAHAGAFGSALKEASSGLVQLDAGGAVVAAKSFDAYLIDLAAHPQGGVVFFGWGAPIAGGSIGCAGPLTGSFVAAFDPAGGCAWSHDMLAGNVIGSVTADASGVFAAYGTQGDLAINGYGLGGASQFGMSVVGQVITSSASSGPGGLAAVVDSSVPVQVDGNVLSGQPDTLAVLRLGPEGSLHWAKSSNIAGNNVSVASCVDAQGALLILGTSNAPIDLGLGPLDDGAGSFLVKLSP